MTDAIGTSASTPVAAMTKSSAGQMDRPESAAREGKDFAATFDEVRQRNEPTAAAEPAPAANNRQEAANSDLADAALPADAGFGVISVAAPPIPAPQPVSPANEDPALGDPVATDPAAAAAMAQQLMPLAPSTSVAPQDATGAGDTDPATAVAAAAGQRAAAGGASAVMQAVGAGGAPLRPELRAAVQRTGLDGAPPTVGDKPPVDPGSDMIKPGANAGTEKPADAQSSGAKGEFKLEQGAVTGDAGKASPPDAADKAAGTPGAEQAVAATTGRERDARAEVVRLDTRLPLHSPRFAEGFGQQVVVLTQHGIQQAQMSLNPPDLGPIDVRITVTQDQASVQIAAGSVAARDVIQDALPKLRDLLDQSGVRLSDAGVFAQLPQREHASSYAQRQTWLVDVPGARRRAEPELAQPAARGQRVGLIDAYA